MQPLIIGGGPVGCALSLLLAHEGIASLVVEKSQEIAHDERGYAISKGSQHLFQKIGVWDHLALNAEPILSVQAGESPVFLNFFIPHQALGFIIEGGFLRQTLANAAKNHPLITWTHEAPLQKKLVIGADGASSSTRTEAGIEVCRRDYHQTALVFTVAHQTPHHGIAYEFFLPEGPLAILPMTRQRSSIVWALHPVRAQFFQDHPQEMLEEISSYLPFQGLDSLSEIQSYPLFIQWAKRFIGENLALVGNAAHVIHPLAGQGLNLGLCGAQNLADVLIRSFSLGLPPLLKQYEKQQRRELMVMGLLTDGLNRLFSNPSNVLRSIRSIGMRVARHMPVVTERALRYAVQSTLKRDPI